MHGKTVVAFELFERLTEGRTRGAIRFDDIAQFHQSALRRENRFARLSGRSGSQQLRDGVVCGGWFLRLKFGCFRHGVAAVRGV